MKPNKEKSSVILDGKYYDTVLLDIISDISKLRNLNEQPAFKGEASLKPFLHKLKL